MDRTRFLLVIGVALGVIVLGVFLYFVSRQPRSPMAENVARQPGREISFIVEDLSERLAAIEKRADFTSDISFPLFDDGNVSFHVHAMQVGQLCPLHIHQNSEEGVFIVRGKARIDSLVSDGSGTGGGAQRKETLLGKNAFFFAPPGSAHEFFNASDEILACLVVHTPPFQGNLYLKEEAIARSPEPSFQDLSAMADSMEGAGSGEVAVAKVEVFENLLMRLMRTSSPLDENMAKGHDLIIVYFGGEALFEIRDRKVDLKPTYFLGIPAGTPFRITPSRDSHDSYLLCFYLPPR